ncbi:MAG: PIN domain-containing protein, partial [Beijerinckiaceae bacterium]|nr:PIN domain-containing protein [Beijerinckiaceae bacterium]
GKAVRFMQDRTYQDPAYISLIVLTETVWVLTQRLQYRPEFVADAVHVLLSCDFIAFEKQESLVSLFNSDSNHRTDIADYLIAASNRYAGCTKTITFDRKAAKAVDGMELLK